MSDDEKKTAEGQRDGHVLDGRSPDGSIKNQETYAYDESRKIGVTGAVFLILNKMIGTGGMMRLNSSTRVCSR